MNKQFSGNENENQENQTEEPKKNHETDDEKNYKGIHINKKILKIAAAIVIMFFVYNAVKKSPDDKNIKEDKSVEKNMETETKENPFTSSYSDSGVRDIAPTTYNNYNSKENTSNNVNQDRNIEYERELERIRQLEEEAKQAKESAISFQIYDVKNQTQEKKEEEKVYVDYDQNRQASKKDFLMNEKASKFYSNSVLVPPVSPYELKSGDFIPAIVETAMNSDTYGKVVVAKVTQNIYDTVTGNYLLIPQGTTITGVYDSNITWGQERLLVIWQRLRFPNGDSINLENMQGVDMLGQAGLPGKVNNHFATLLKGVLLSSAMGATAAIVTNDDEDNNDWQGEAGEGAGLAIIQIGDKFTTKALDRQPTITISQGDRFNIMVHADLILKPYEI